MTKDIVSNIINNKFSDAKKSFYNAVNTAVAGKIDDIRASVINQYAESEDQDGEDNLDENDLDEGVSVKSNIYDIKDEYRKVVGKNPPAGTSKQSLIIAIDKAKRGE